jgi:hypothetical protein
MWTSEPPSENGIYWWRRGNGHRPEPVRIYNGFGSFCHPHAFSEQLATIPGEWWPEQIREPVLKRQER